MDISSLILGFLTSLPFLAVGLGGTAAILGGALALGVRHGIDWDHIAAITDITSTSATVPEPEERWLTEEPGLQLTDEGHHRLAGATAASDVPHVHGGEPHTHADAIPPAMPVSTGGVAVLTRAKPLEHFVGEQRRALLMGTLYALGHGTVVIVLGLLAILASEFLPEWIDPLMERVVGITLLVLAAYLFYSLYRFFRSGEEFRIRSRWMLVFAAVGNLYQRFLAKLHGQHEHSHVVATQQYGARTAYGVGMIHGIGAETGTQVLIIATAVGASSQAMSVLTLFAFVFGLLISNSLITIATSAGFVSAQRRQWIYVGVGILAAVFSLIVGLVFLFEATGILPDLDQYFHWIGGPSPD